MTTVLPSSRHSRTIRATWTADDQLPFTTARGPFTVELEVPLVTRLELTESRELSALPLFEIGDDLADYVIQLIRSFRAGNADLFGQPSGQLGLLHLVSC